VQVLHECHWHQLHDHERSVQVLVCMIHRGSSLFKSLCGDAMLINRSAPARSGGDSAMGGGGFGEFGAGTGPVRPSSSAGSGNYTDQAEQLSQMGFDKQRALEILQIVNGNMELALDMLSS